MSEISSERWQDSYIYSSNVKSTIEIVNTESAEDDENAESAEMCWIDSKQHNHCGITGFNTSLSAPPPVYSVFHGYIVSPIYLFAAEYAEPVHERWYEDAR